jgi:hypothetical protein
MKNSSRYLLLAIAIGAVAVSSPSMAEPLEDGMAAYNEKDYVTAVKLWRPLAEQGIAAAQYQLGVLYAEGKGVTASDLIAFAWFQRAAEQGVAGAQYNLGVSFAEGLGTRRDDTSAAKWFRRAADQGMPYAQLNLGLLYSTGRGVPQDNVEAVKWLELAIFSLPAGGARSDAAGALKDVADKMTDEELLKARGLQRDFKARPETK